MSSISQLFSTLEKKVTQLEKENVSEVGIVSNVADGIARVMGLSSVRSGEILNFASGATGVALNLEDDNVGVVLMNGAHEVKEGERVERSNNILSIPVNESVLGRVLDPLMYPLDGGAVINTKHRELIEKIASGVMTREPVNQPMQTGLKAVDALIPIGRGQRELIIGDRQTGKTTIAIDTIINQKGKGMKCVYVAIGQKESKIAQIVEKLKDAGAMDYTVVILAGVSKGAAMSYIAPYSGVAVAEYFMNRGEDVLIIYDDLSKHAVAYREMSLLLRRPGGREAYPGDVFYLHSRLLERACRRNAENGGGSITALPIIETQAGDVSAYIPTNVISITDGQIFLDSNLFYKGVRPAIDVGLSVSRVGGSAQTKAMKKNAGMMKLSLAQYRELESFSQFDSDLDAETKATLERGKRTVEMLKQKNDSPLSVAEQVASIYSVNKGYCDKLELGQVLSYENHLHHVLNHEYIKLADDMNEGKWSDEIESELKACISTALKTI